MSGENVDVILGLPIFRPGADFVSLTRDTGEAAKLADEVTPLLHEDFECVFPNLLGGDKTYPRASGNESRLAGLACPMGELPCRDGTRHRVRRPSGHVI